MGKCAVLAVAVLLALPGLAAGPAHADCDGPPWLRLEIVGAEVGAGEPLETIAIDADGCVSSQFPPFDRRAGSHRHQLSVANHRALTRFMASSGIHGFDAATARAQLGAQDTRGGERVFHISDAEITRLVVYEGGIERVIEWASPQLEYEMRGRPAVLHPLASVIERLQGVVTELIVPQ